LDKTRSTRKIEKFIAIPLTLKAIWTLNQISLSSSLLELKECVELKQIELPVRKI
jgi:hypothetical protein